MIHILIDIALVVVSAGFGVLFGRKNPKKVEKAVAEIKSVEDKAKNIIK